jgi:hypothetical protein
MKIIKIILAITVVVVLGFFVWKWIVGLKPPPPPSPPENQFTERIKQEIDSLGKLSDSKFCEDYHKEVAYHIDSYHKEQRLGNNESENRQWKENLSKDLYAAYAEKFIKQTFYVFEHSEWNISDLKFIHDETKTLQKSPFLERTSLVGTRFTEIQQILKKYDEISGFISSCKGFSYSYFNLSDRFPVSEMERKISRAAEYRNNDLKNSYVKNCTRLHEGLKGVPKMLFKSHVQYLDTKFNQWTGKYFLLYYSQKEYRDILYDNLKEEIDLLENSIYNIGETVVDKEYDRLKDRLDTDSRNAYKYFSNKK